MTANYSFTIAMYIWRTIHNDKVDSDRDRFWEVAAKELAGQAHWHSLQLINQQIIDELAMLPASSKVSASIAETGHDASLPTVDMSALPLVLLAKTYAQLQDMMHNGLDSDQCIDDAPLVVSDYMARARFQLPETSPEADRPKSSEHIRKLRAGLLLLKIVSVLSTITTRHKQLQKATTSVWTAFGTMALSLKQQAGRGKLHNSEVEEARMLALHMTKLAIPVLKTIVKTDPTGAFCSCLMLEHLMVSTKPAVHLAVAVELLTQGLYSP